MWDNCHRLVCVCPVPSRTGHGVWESYSIFKMERASEWLCEWCESLGWDLEVLLPSLTSHFLLDCWLWTSDKSTVLWKADISLRSASLPTLPLVVYFVGHQGHSQHSTIPLNFSVLRTVHILSGCWLLTRMGHSPWWDDPSSSSCQGWFLGPVHGPPSPGPSMLSQLFNII